jgi:hypothetical protein
MGHAPEVVNGTAIPKPPASAAACQGYAREAYEPQSAETVAAETREHEIEKHLRTSKRLQSLPAYGGAHEHGRLYGLQLSLTELVGTVRAIVKARIESEGLELDYAAVAGCLPKPENLSRSPEALAGFVDGIVNAWQLRREAADALHVFY